MLPGPKMKLDAVLAVLPANALQVAARMGCVRSTADLRLKRLRKLGLAHVGRWTRTRGWPMPTYVAGAGKDVPRPLARTNAETIKKWKRKNKKELDLRRAEKQLALAQTVIPKRPQSIFSALGL